MSERDFFVREHETRTLSWWWSRRSKIDMEPPYQRRGRLWSATDKAYLVDSILNGYDIPKLYMADFTWGESALNISKLPYAIIDGKQRFEAIFDFFQGRIVLNDDFVYLDDPSKHLGGLGYEDLRANHYEVAEVFENYNLMVMSVFAKTDEPISELFVRLNRSKSLTGAEIRNAMAGPAPVVIRQIAKHEFFTTNIRFTVTRGQDLNAAAKILLFEFFKKLLETKKRNLDGFVGQTAEAPDKLELSVRQVFDVLDAMSEIFLPRDQVLGSGGIMPVYYWFIRSRKENEYPIIREFLVSFERKREENRRLVREVPGSKNIDQELVEFDGFNRSTNDQQSHVGRYDLLVDRFVRFLEEEF